MYYKKRPRTLVMTPRRRKLCRPLARGSKCALARRCLNDRSVKKYIVKGMGASLRHEIAQLCSDNSTFLLRNKHPDTLKTFSWERLLEQAKHLAPTLTELLLSCTKTRRPRKNRNAIIGLLVGVMCKNRRPAVSLIQQITSLILYSGHASKRVSDNSGIYCTRLNTYVYVQVYDRLQKVGLCLSHGRTIKLVDRLGEGFDERVLHWKSLIESTMDPHEIEVAGSVYIKFCISY